MRPVAIGSSLVAVLLLAGCGMESPRQADARVAVEEVLPASVYDVDRTRCTDEPSPWFVPQGTDNFVCAARRHDGRCDWYQATLRNSGWEVVLKQRDAGCVLSV